MTDTTNRKNMFVGTGELTSGFPPRKPYVGRMTADWDTPTGRFPDRDNPARMVERQSLKLVVEPLDHAAETVDGNITYFISMPRKDAERKNKQSYYGLTLAAIEAGAADILGEVGFKLANGDDFERLVGLVGVWKEEPGETSPLFASMRQGYKSEKNFPILVGPAPQGWQSTIPADLAQQKQAAQDRAKAREAARQAEQNGPVSTSAIPSSVVGTPTAAPTVASDPVLAIAAAFYVGKNDTQITQTAGTRAGLKEKIPDNMLLDVFSGNLAATLQAKNLITLDAAGTYQAGPALTA